MISSIFLITSLSPLISRVTCSPLTSGNTTADVITNSAAYDVGAPFDDAAAEIHVSSVSVEPGQPGVDTSVCRRLMRTKQAALSSTCPWHYEEHLHVHRQPQRVVRAVLTCGEGCLMMRGPDQKGPAGRGSTGRSRCQPIHHLVSVTYLDRASSTSASGSDVPRNETGPVWLPVPFAYTCAFDGV